MCLGRYSLLTVESPASVSFLLAAGDLEIYLYFTREVKGLAFNFFFSFFPGTEAFQRVGVKTFPQLE